MDAPLPWRPPDPFPLPILTERLRIDWYRPEDAPSLQRAIDGHRESLLPWLPWARTDHRTVDATRAVIDRFARDRSFVEATDFVMAMFDRATGEIVGGTGIHRVHRETADAEVGYWLRGDLRGRGLCTEAVAALLSSAFGPWGLRRVRVTCDGDNVASRRVPERLGLRLESVERAASWVEGAGWQDEWAFAVLAPEWDAVAGRAVGTDRGRAPEKGFGATDPRIAPYVAGLLEPEDDVLREIRERSEREGLPPIAVGPFDGRHLEVLARAAGARRIVEIGTLGGYSGVCLARALPAGGVLHTFELDPRHAKVAEESFRRAGVLDRVRLHIGPALRELPKVEAEGPFDLVFVDADKASYPAYLVWSARNLRIGGTVLADNVFRRAAFAVPGDDPANARGIREFDESLARSGRFRATFLPLEDGLGMGVRIA